jgi:hypothetical protein
MSSGSSVRKRMRPCNRTCSGRVSIFSLCSDFFKLKNDGLRIRKEAERQPFPSYCSAAKDRQCAIDCSPLD